MCKQRQNGNSISRGDAGSSSDDCKREWAAARVRCRILIDEQLRQRTGRSKRRSLTGVTGGYYDIEKCARGLVSEACGGNKVEGPKS